MVAFVTYSFKVFQQVKQLVTLDFRFRKAGKNALKKTIYRRLGLLVN